MIRPGGQTPVQRILIAVVMAVTTPAAAHADVFAVPFMGMKFGGGTSIVDLEIASGAKKFTMGLAAQEINDGVLGYEVFFGYLPGYFEGDDGPLGSLVKSGSFVIDFTGNVILSLPPHVTAGGLRPYVVVGGGLVHVQAEDGLATFKIRRTMPVGNFGAGAVGLFTNNVGVRFDLRYLRSLTTDDGSLANVGRRISYSRFTIGVFLRL